MIRKLLPWAVFFAFAITAVAFSWHDDLLKFGGTMGVLKGLVWLAFILFTGYSMYCSSRENIFKSIGRIAEFHWGRQVGIDLYLGLLLFFCVVYLHSGFAVLLLWLLPTLLFANLATLLYVAIHFESLASRFIA